jgi:hypothetical protein
MKRLLTTCAASLALAGLLAPHAPLAQEAIRVRGTIVSLEGSVLMVKSRDGSDVRVDLTPDVGFAYVRTVKLDEVKPGTPLGTAAITGPGGKLIARELHLFPADKPIPAEGHRPWDLEPGSTMTNARVSAMTQATGNRELTLSYPGGQQQIIVPPDIPVVETVAADRSLMKTGEYVLVNATRAEDGRISAARVLVSRDGVRPPQ